MSATISKFFSGAPKSAEELRRILNDAKSESEKYDNFYPFAVKIYDFFKTDFEFEQNKDNYPTLFDEGIGVTEVLGLPDDSFTQISIQHQQMYSQMYKEVLNLNMESWLDHYRLITYGFRKLTGTNTTNSPETKDGETTEKPKQPFPPGNTVKESKGIRGRYYALEGVLREVEKQYNKSVDLYEKTLNLLINVQQKTNPYLKIFPKNEHLGELLNNNPTKSDLIILKCMITSAYNVFDINKDEKSSIEPQNMDGIQHLTKKTLSADTNIAKHQIIEYLLIAGVYLGAGTVTGTGAVAITSLLSTAVAAMIGPAAIAVTTALIAGPSYAAYQKAFHNPNDKSFLELSKVNIRYLLSPEVLKIFQEKKVDAKKELEKANEKVERYFNDDGTRSFSKRVQAAYRAFKHGGKIKQKKTRKKKKN